VKKTASCLLSAAIEDNIAWCSAVCAAHASEARNTEATWVNLAPSPLYYPNIITRQPSAQAEVARLVDEVRRNGMRGSWGIKDSFHDLDLTPLGFSPAIEAQWFAGTHAMRSRQREHSWEVVRRPEDLLLWERAWGGGDEHRLFKDGLLGERRIRFWKLGHQEEIFAGCITFSSGKSTGLSNWFSKRTESIFELGVMQAVAETIDAKPVVCWAAEDERLPSGFQPLGPLRIWISEAASA
jgi:hypothetical protein